MDRLTTWRTPAPTDEQARAERRYKKVVSIVLHNEPCSVGELNRIYAYGEDHRDQPVRPILRRAMDNGHVRRQRDGWVATDAVE